MERKIELDILKGIGIICVIIGHYIVSCNNMQDVYRFIYSFHMPLFFVVSGYLYKENPNILGMVKKDFTRLLVPYYMCNIAIFLWLFIVEIRHGFLQKSTSRLFAMFYGSSMNEHTSIWLNNIPDVGPLWFLLGLFWCKFFYNIMHDRVNFVFILFISILSALVQYYVVNFPLCILVGISCMPFFAIGNIIKNNIYFEDRKVLLFILCLIAWGLCSLYKMALHSCYYENILLNYCGAISAIYVIYHLAKLIKSKALATIGKCSLSILCVHSFFYLTGLWNWDIFPDYAIIKIAMDLFLSFIYICLKNKFIPDSLGLKKYMP